MDKKTIRVVTVAVFSIIALLHLLRLILQFDVVFAGWSVPLWASGIGVVLAGLLAWGNAKGD